MSQTYIPADVRKLVRERAKERCEYCLIPENAAFALHEIDHVISEKHGGKTDESNLALSCDLCNGRKGSDISSIDPENGQLNRLYNPRQDSWSEHFCLVDGRITPLTPIGRVTVRLLQLNQLDRVEERLLLIEAGEIDVGQ